MSGYRACKRPDPCGSRKATFGNPLDDPVLTLVDLGMPQVLQIAQYTITLA